MGQCKPPVVPAQGITFVMSRQVFFSDAFFAFRSRRADEWCGRTAFWSSHQSCVCDQVLVSAVFLEVNQAFPLPGIEAETSCTQTKSHTTRPKCHYVEYYCQSKVIVYCIKLQTTKQMQTKPTTLNLRSRVHGLTGIASSQYRHSCMQLLHLHL